MIASSALGSECVAAQNVEVTFMKLPKFRKPENWPNCLGCHALTSQSTASYHTHNERGDSGLSYEPKLWRIHWSGPEESAVSRSIKTGAHCPVWESRGPEGIRKFRILRGALKIVSMLWIYHLIHGIKIFCFKHFLIYCLPIMSIHSEGWRQENQIVARRRNSFEYKLWLNLKSDILMSNFQLFFLKNIK